MKDVATTATRHGWSLVALAGATEALWLVFLAWLAWRA
jgi:hypothetical protein